MNGIAWADFAGLCLSETSCDQTDSTMGRIAQSGVYASAFNRICATSSVDRASSTVAPIWIGA